MSGIVAVETWDLQAWGFNLSGGTLLQGLFTGLTYGLLGIGLVLVYRSSRFINFAHIGIGLFGAAIVSAAVNEYGLPYWPSLVVGMGASALAAVVTEVGVVRKLAGTPKVLPMVATLGMSSFFLFAALALYGDGLQGLNFPLPDGLPTFEVDAFAVRTADTAQALVGPLVLVALAVFLQRSRYGVAIRGAASNPDAAALAGVSPAAMSMLGWGLAGAMACFSVSLLIPSKGAISPESLGPDLLLRALAAAAIVRFRSLGGVLVAAIGIGLVDQVVASNSDANGWADLVIFVAVVASLLLTTRAGRSGREAPEPWDGLATPRRLPPGYEQVALLRQGPRLLAAAAFVVAVLVPLAISNATAVTLTQLLALALVGVSVTIISGLGGQLSLGQFALGGIGCAVAVIVADATGSFLVGLLAAVGAGGVASALIGVPALRVKGLLLGVATLSFSLVCSGWLLRQDFFLTPDGRDTAAPDLGLVDGASRNYYWVVLAGLSVGIGLAHNLRHGAFGRKLLAVRDNAEAARALTVAATRIRIQAYVVAGMLAGLGGALYGQAQDRVDVVTFPVQRSIDVVVVAVVGGIGSLAGPVLGALYVFGVPELLEIDDNEARAGLSAAWLVLLTLQPNGFAGLLADVGDHLRDLVARWSGLDPEAAHRAEDQAAAGEAELRAADHLAFRAAGSEAADPSGRASGRDEPLLVVEGLTRRFGGLVAVDDVHLEVHRGETLGLIGPNGAGKTTLFEMISGFVRPDQGRIRFDGVDVTAWRPEQRSRAGMVRSFQSATLFPTLTLLETVMVARERSTPSTLVESALGRRAAEREREADARRLVELFGLGAFAEVPVGVLPTGTRRLVELTCAVALEPTLILLDEPSAGIAQAETEELGRVLRAIREAYGVTFVVIEHDVPLLTSICDRMVALEVGRVIATGTPQEVQQDPAVVESYLGTNAVAVARSGATA